MFLANYLGIMQDAEADLAGGFRKVADGDAAEADIYHTCHTLAKQCDAHAEALKPFVDRYGEQKSGEPDRLYHDFLEETRSGSFGLLRDLRDLYMVANFCDITWTMIGQAAQGMRYAQKLWIGDLLRDVVYLPSEQPNGKPARQRRREGHTGAKRTSG